VTWQTDHLETLAAGYADLVVRCNARVYVWDRLQVLADLDPELYATLPDLVTQRVKELRNDPPDPPVPDQR